jgi:hypothetical protein
MSHRFQHQPSDFHDDHDQQDRSVNSDYGRQPSLEEENSYHFQHKTYLMSEPEAEFFRSLERLIGDRYYIFPQIHLGTVMNPRTTRLWRTQSGRVRFPRIWHLASIYSDRYSLDYVICDQASLKPVLAIEFDDSTHRWHERRRRDRFVERALAEANLPLQRFTYDMIAAEAAVFEQLKQHLPALQ